MERPEHWEKIKHIVGEALELSPELRSTFLDAACAQNPELRAEVDSLLSAHGDAGELSLAPWSEQVLDAALVGQSIGPYRLLRKLGEGGMGQVWLAEQTAPVRRQVAVKLISGGMFNSVVLQRFQSERQSLAIMDHPSIAKVFDAGATPQGQPYFVMEFVEGLPITKYCDLKKLSIPDRLRLFVQVCDGIQHAHQKAIIHRDIKPANILVVEVDGKPTPRIIDFGLAKAVAAPDSGETLFTQAGAFLGTPGYTSPEQSDPSVQDIDTRADVYSLGVVLYELLTGDLPFDPQRLRKQSIDQVLRLLRDEDPPSPSTKVSSDRTTSSALAALRGTDSAQLATLLRGDLDWITMKALERDRERRYASPSEFAADLNRYLSNRPVLARPASAGYRLQKYIRRNRVAVSVAAGALVLLLAFTVTQAFQLRRITRERDRANRITAFMTSMFKVSDPSQARGNSITAREILDKSSKEIETGLAQDPLLQAQLMDLMGTVYQSLGLFPQSQPLLEKAVAIRLRLLGAENPDTLRSQGTLAWSLAYQSKPADAERMLRETLQTQRRVLGTENADTAATMNHLAGAILFQGHFPESDKLNRETLDIRRRILGPEHELTLQSMFNLSLELQESGQYAEAEKWQLEALEIQRRVLGPYHPSTLASMRSLAAIYDDEGHFPQAEKLFRETLELDRKYWGPEHPETLRCMHRLALVIFEQGRYKEAEPQIRELLAVKRRVLGPQSADIVGTIEMLALCLAHEGRIVDAEPLFREALQTTTRLGVEKDYAEANFDYASGLVVAGRRDEAFPYLRKAVELHWRETEDMANDDELKPLRGDPRFEALVASVKQSAANSASATH